VQLTGHLGQRGGAHYGRSHLGQLSLGQERVGAVDVVGDDQAEDRVTEELEALIRFVPRVLRTP